MRLPPIIYPAEDTAWLENLQALAAAQSALSSYAAAESNKLTMLAAYMTELEALRQSRREIDRQAAASCQTACGLQTVLNSCLQELLQSFGTESLYDLKPLPKDCSGIIHAQGSGFISSSAPPPYCGAAIRLQQADFTVSLGSVICSSLRCCLSTPEFRYSFEGIQSGLRVASLGDLLARPAPNRPNVLLLTGYGVFGKEDCHTAVWRELAWFALNLWDYGFQTNQDKFRLLVVTAGAERETFDSGIIS